MEDRLTSVNLVLSVRDGDLRFHKLVSMSSPAMFATIKRPSDAYTTAALGMRGRVIFVWVNPRLEVIKRH